MSYPLPFYPLTLCRGSRRRSPLDATRRSDGPARCHEWWPMLSAELRELGQKVVGSRSCVVEVGHKTTSPDVMGEVRRS